ncbi:MAG: YbgC/FadM family acyl-CoA thioesterase [Ahrensia sp.]|nr:YbgC/FadM family acyl-CoA thioesterase [Ahrensia sp.]
MTIDQLGKSEMSVELAGQITDKVHRLVARVYFADTDFSGAVYHARYLEFLERGRSDFLRCLGVHHTDLLHAEDGPFFWIIKRMEIDFVASASIDDVLSIETRLEIAGGARCVMAQRIMRGNTVLIHAVVTAALINSAGKPRRFLPAWRDKFASVLMAQAMPNAQS